jgi:hypothetical protein
MQLPFCKLIFSIEACRDKKGFNQLSMMNWRNVDVVVEKSVVSLEMNKVRIRF